jgi:subfamily B ATP-binding cassette protein MsbA
MSKDESKKNKVKDATVVLKKSSKSLTSLIFELIKPYKKWLFVIFAAMLLETAMSLLGPWPLKIIIDNVVGHHPLPEWLHWINDLPFEDNRMALA